MRSTHGLREALTGLVLVFALDLEDVEEVGCCGVDLNQVVVWSRYGIWEVLDFEFLRTLEEVASGWLSD